MAETKNDNPPRKTRRSRQERRFESSSSQRSIASLCGTIVGSLVLGAGIYSQWVSSRPLEQAPWIVGAGAVVLAAVILWGDFGGHAIRVGDAGVALERPGHPLQRVNWAVMSSITIKNGELLVRSEERDLTFSVSKYPSAAAWVLKEAKSRIPKKLDVSEEDRSALPKAKESDGVQIPLEKLQITGLKCRASSKVITFEKDARECPKCGEVYHRSSLPATCLTCDADLKALKAKS